jgi:transcriptional regulator with XRE-family HTH domain
VKAETVGQRIHRLRTEAGLSQRSLAQGLDRVGYAYISRIEAGTRQPSGKALRALAQRLGTTALYLETGREDTLCPHCGRGAQSSSILRST